MLPGFSGFLNYLLARLDDILRLGCPFRCQFCDPPPSIRLGVVSQPRRGPKSVWRITSTSSQQFSSRNFLAGIFQGRCIACPSCALGRIGAICRNGTVSGVFTALTGARDNQYLMIDSTIVRAHQQAASEKGRQILNGKYSSLGNFLSGGCLAIRCLSRSFNVLNPAKPLSLTIGLVSCQILLGSWTFVQAQQAHPDLTTSNCPIDHDKLVTTLKASVKASGGPSNGGLDTNEWAVVVRRDGSVCAVAYSGANWDSQWIASRSIAAAKASTANSFSLKDKAMSTANLYAGSQPGGFLYGLLTSQPVDTNVIYSGEAEKFGSSEDPMVGKRAGGIITFGGGLALYDSTGIVGAIGVSGDTSCADHNVAWRVRHTVDLDHSTGGVGDLKDGILYDLGLTGTSSSGFGHPKCAGKEADIAGDIGAGK